MNTFIKFAAVACSVVIGFTASAVPITGTINFTGTATLDAASPATATQVLSWSDVGGMGMPQVQNTSGSFVGSSGNVAIMAPWSFNSGPVANFWSVNGFTFDLTASQITSQGVGLGGAFLTVGGIGTISKVGFDATPGTWSFSTQDGAAGLFSFSAGTVAQGVPDGGTTVLLLGAALSGLGLLRRKLIS